jgi:hypothetical protein
MAAECPAANPYPGDAAGKPAIASWMALAAARSGVPRELPVMAALEASGLANLQSGDADAVGYFAMRTGVWNQGEYAGYPEKPELQVKWFLDQARAVRQSRLAAGSPDPAADPSRYGEWIADVERPAEHLRGRYQLRLEEARGLIGPACTEPDGAEPGPGEPPPGSSPDVTRPKLSLKAKGTQRALRAKAVLVRVGCPAERCVIAVSGSVSLPGAARVYRFASKPRSLAGGASRTVRLSLPKSLRGALRHTLKRRRAVRAKLTVRAVDASGNVTRRRVTLRLVR